jgi:hypothetical protein
LNPPHGVGDELETTCFVKTLCGLDQTEVALVDQVRQRQTLVLVLLGLSKKIAVQMLDGL